MSNRTIFGAIAAILLFGMLCVCGFGLFLLVGSGELANLRASFPAQPASAPAAQATTVVPLSDPNSPKPGSAPASTGSDPLALPSDGLSILRAEEEVLNQVYEQVVPSVVNISVSGSASSLLGDLGQGSGWLWDEAGHIVTNNHVVEQAESLFVTFSDGTQTTAEVVGRDEDSDLAVIRVEVLPDGLRPLMPGSSSALRVGQRVIAIGNPFGFEGTMTLGVVSATERTIPGVRASPDGTGSFSLPNLVQTDAAINPGNSGGPLLDIEGRVVGVNTLIFSQNANVNSGVGFAVPVDKVTAVVPSLIATGVYETPYLGISAFSTALTPELAQELQLQGVSRGVLVQSVTSDGPSADAGVRGGDQQVTLPGFLQPITTGGDVVISIDEQPVSDFDDLINYLDTRAVGDEVVLTIIRQGEQIQIPVTLGARP